MLRLLIALNVICALAVIAAGCRKPDPVTLPDSVSPPVTTGVLPGLPQGADSTHGVLTAFYEYSELPGNKRYKLTLTALFREPVANFLAILDPHSGPRHPGQAPANISVGEVWFNDQELQGDSAEGRWWYWHTKLLPWPFATENVNWSTEGNKSFRPIEASLERGFPEMTDSSLFVKRSESLAIYPGKIFSNYDSIHLRIYPNHDNYNQVWKCASAKTQLLTFDTSAVLDSDPGSYYTIAAVAVNYSHITIEDKRYVFVLAKRFIRPVAVEP